MNQENYHEIKKKEIKEDIKYDDQKMDNDISNNGIKISLYNNGYENDGFYYGKICIGSNNHEINVPFDVISNDMIIFEDQYVNYGESTTFNPIPLPSNISSIKVDKFYDSFEIKGPICNDIIKYNKPKGKTQNIKFLFATEEYNSNVNYGTTFGLGIKNKIFNEFAFYYDNKNKHKNSNVILNGYDEALLTNKYHEIPLIKNRNYYYFNINEWNVTNGNDSTNVFKNITVKVDIDTNRICLPSKYYNKVIKTILDDNDIKYDLIETKNKKYKSILIESKYQSKLPILSFKINNNITLTLNGYQYTRICSINNNYCWILLQELTTINNIIFGIPFLIHYYIVFNIKNKSIKLKEIPNNYDIITKYDDITRKPKYAPPLYSRSIRPFDIPNHEWKGLRSAAPTQDWISSATYKATWDIKWYGSDGDDSKGTFYFTGSDGAQHEVSPTNISQPLRWGFIQIISEFESNEVQSNYKIGILGTEEMDNNNKTETITYKFYEYYGGISAYDCVSNDSTNNNRFMWKYITHPLYRYYNGDRVDHYYTNNPEPDIPTDKSEGIACDLQNDSSADFTPIYCFYSRSLSNHLYVMYGDPKPSGSGYTEQGIIGYGAKQQMSGLVPFYHYTRNDGIYDDFYTANSNEMGNNGNPGNIGQISQKNPEYTYQGILCYVWPTPNGPYSF